MQQGLEPLEHATDGDEHETLKHTALLIILLCSMFVVSKICHIIRFDSNKFEQIAASIKIKAWLLSIQEEVVVHFLNFILNGFFCLRLKEFLIKTLSIKKILFVLERMSQPHNIHKYSNRV